MHIFKLANYTAIPMGFLYFVLAMLLLGANVARADSVWSTRQAPALQARELRGRGDWKTDGQVQRPSQDWDLDLQRDGNNLTGRIALADSPLMTDGTVAGRIEGSRISGAIIDLQGQEVARFQGRITDGTMRGTYRDRTGETGEWSWAGRLPE